MDISVAIVSSYLRVNGYFLIDGFEVHHIELSGYRTLTDVDVLAVRPPTAPPPVHYRGVTGAAECLIVTEVDPALEVDERCHDVILGEVKAGGASFNPGLHRPEVLHAALRRVGDVHGAGLDQIVDDLIAHGESRAPEARTRLMAFAAHGSASRGATRHLDDLLAFLRQHLVSHRDLYRASHMSDPVLGLLELDLTDGR